VVACILLFLFSVYLDGCGGALIGPKVVLTAGHCCGQEGGNAIVRNGQIRTIVKERRHPSYVESTLENDFCLFQLDKTVSTTTSTKIRLSLNRNGTLPTGGQSLTVMGYGRIEEDGDYSKKLRDVKVPAVKNSECYSAYGDIFRKTIMFCAGKLGKDACSGDSGGPIILRRGNRHIVLGVVSYGLGCAREDYPGVYARVSAVTTWIKNVACTEWRNRVYGLCSP